MHTGFLTNDGQLLVLAFATIVGTTIAIAPPITYLLRGWRTKTRQVMNDFDPQTIEAYFKRSWNNEPIRNKAKFAALRKEHAVNKLSDLDADNPEHAKILVSQIKSLYEDYFGRKLFVSPLILLALSVFTLILFSIRSALYFSEVNVANTQDITAPHILLDHVSIAGIGGAFLWVVGDGIRRMRANDYLPSDIYSHVLRMAIAIALGQAFALVSTTLGTVVAFSVGMFPLETISRYLRTITTKQIGVTNDPDTDGDEIKRLIGVNNDVAYRLMAENVATILALSNSDPIRLTMKTNLDFEVVLDIMDQAIVSTMFSPSKPDVSNRIIDGLRVSALSMASQISKLMWLRGEGDQNCVALLQKLPSLLGIEIEQLIQAFETISRDERTVLVVLLRQNNNRPGNSTSPSPALAPAVAVAR